MLSVAFNYCYAECRYAESYYAKCHDADCRYAECRGAVKCRYMIIGASFHWANFL
jgi:hypothetical protein